MERHPFILNQLNLRNKLLPAKLAGQRWISDDTTQSTRRCFTGNGAVIKELSGTLSLSFCHGYYTSKGVYSYTYKYVIAQQAALRMKDGLLVFTGSTTTLCECSSHAYIDLIVSDNKNAKSMEVIAGNATVSESEGIIC